MEHLISVIVPVYNVEPYLKRCLDSILSQTYKNLEIILINDGSTDNSGEICEEYSKKDKRIRLIHQINKGAASARNVGLNIVKGSYITFVDSDDYIECDMLEKLYDNRVPEGFVGNGSIIIYKNKQKIVKSKKYYKLEKNKALQYYLTESANWGAIKALDFFIGNSLNNKLFDAKLFKKLRLDTKLRMAEDMDCIVKILLNSKEIVLLPYAKYYYIHQNSNSTTSKKFNINYMDFLKVKFRIEKLVSKYSSQYIKLAEAGTLFACVYIITQIAKLDFYSESRYNDLLVNLKEEILKRKKAINQIGIYGKIKLYIIMINLKLYLILVKFIRGKVFKKF